MKEIVFKLYDSLEDEYSDFICTDAIEKDNTKLVGFTFASNYNKDPYCIKSEIDSALTSFKEMINALINKGKIEKIFYIGMLPLAVISPRTRVSFFCYCNDYGGKSDFEGYEIGELPKEKNIDKVISFIEALRSNNVESR